MMRMRKTVQYETHQRPYYKLKYNLRIQKVFKTNHMFLEYPLPVFREEK